MQIRAASAAVAILLLSAGQALAWPYGIGIDEGRGGVIGDGHGEGVFDRIIARELYLDIRGARKVYCECRKAEFDRLVLRIDSLADMADQQLSREEAHASEAARARYGGGDAAAQAVEAQRKDLNTPLGQAANDSHFVHTSLSNFRGGAFDFQECPRLADR